jgi:hypothetical protein
MTKEDDRRHKYAFMMSAHRDEWIKFGRKKFGEQFKKDRAQVRAIFAGTSSPEEAAKRTNSYFKGPARNGWRDTFKTVWVETGKASIIYMHEFLTNKSAYSEERIVEIYSDLYGYTQFPLLKQEVDEVVGTWESRVNERIQSDAFKDKIVGVNETTQNDIRATIADGVEQGKGHYEIGKDVDAKLEQGWPGRGETISRTEAGSAMNRATLEDGQAAAPDLWKKWSATMVNTRDAHQDADADDPVPQDEPFVVDGEELDCPGDESGSPENIINCGCCVLFVPPLEETAPSGEVPTEEAPPEEVRAEAEALYNDAAGRESETTQMMTDIAGDARSGAPRDTR